VAITTTTKAQKMTAGRGKCKENSRNWKELTKGKICPNHKCNLKNNINQSTNMLQTARENDF